MDRAPPDFLLADRHLTVTYSQALSTHRSPRLQSAAEREALLKERVGSDESPRRDLSRRGQMERFTSRSLFKNWNNIPDKKVPTISPGLSFPAQQKQAEGRQPARLRKPVPPPRRWAQGRGSSYAAPRWRPAADTSRQGWGCPEQLVCPLPSAQAGTANASSSPKAGARRFAFHRRRIFNRTSNDFTVECDFRSEADQEFRKVHDRNGVFRFVYG